MGPTKKPVKAQRIAANTVIPYRVFIQDIYNKAEYKTIEKTGKSPGELHFKPLLEHRKGEIVYLKVFPSQLNTKLEFIYQKQR